MEEELKCVNRKSKRTARFLHKIIVFVTVTSTVRHGNALQNCTHVVVNKVFRLLKSVAPQWSNHNTEAASVDQPSIDL